MKKTFYISILILVFSGIANAQISGQLFLENSEIPGVEVYFKNSELKINSDFDGFFELQIPERIAKADLILKDRELSVEIRNLEFEFTKLDLGKIELPTFKSIDIEEYEQLSELEKKSCYPIKHYANLLGYWYTNKLENDYLTLNCKNKITEFEYNPKTKTVSEDWNLIKDCE
ncbi:hypothetical protein VOP03_04360 [Muricauda sp. SYSU M84420]|uniref:Carboxypeptidase-like regulatory domain-containing protein n=1 Tax=Flagellimonas halotolerans TaxID=3112164 RepID=A0ABU6IN87_9FLAO|nr:hypothetical protein [Muricauda sp. SYSU M84420]